MKFAQLKTAIIDNSKLIVIDLEITILNGLPTFEISGLNNYKGQQCFSRVRASLKNIGFKIPQGRIVCHLTKDIHNGEIRSLDLALAIAILLADGQIFNNTSKMWFIIGQLSLSGKVLSVNGVFAMSRDQSIANYQWIIPLENQLELKCEDFTGKYVVSNLNQAVEIIENINPEKYIAKNVNSNSNKSKAEPIFEIVGQPLAKRALLIALAGRHPLLLIGSPGSGKTTLANQAAYFMPQLNPDKLDQVRRIYSMHGIWNDQIDRGIIRPYQAPHHTITQMALIGGGNNLVPGLITYAHNGILFLDELSEFKPNILELLRQPLSEKFIKLSRKNVSVQYPADFLLIAATNPCPCGYRLENDQRCKCGAADIRRFKKRLSGAILDRFQLSVIMNDLTQTDLIKTAKNKLITQSEIYNIQKVIIKAQKMQSARCNTHQIPFNYNGQIKIQMLADFFEINSQAMKQFNKITLNYLLSPRSYLALLRVARTIADLDQQKEVSEVHLHEALLLRVNPQIY
ncbi:MAG TPA: YifB family Mg chelatase-like AAA ATPase [Clostridiaceae bacterium]|nr:YifB family Mg chelatase-like AAA ATPase [Clostridiaceae bacterium]